MRPLRRVVVILGMVGFAACGSDDPTAVTNTPPAAAFTASCTDLSCTLTDQSTDADGALQAYAWEFGDGGTSTETNPVHAYAAPGGTFTVRLTVTDDDGAASGVEHDVVASPPPAPPAGQLAFVMDHRIYLVNATGTGLVPLSDGPVDGDPAWSPDGSRIAFTKWVAANSGTGNLEPHIYLIDADGSNLVRHLGSGLGQHPTWSPDGDSLAYSCLDGGQSALCVVGADVAAAPVLIVPPTDFVQVIYPDWSPDGSRIAFVAGTVETPELGDPDFVVDDIWVVAPDGSGLTALTHGTLFGPSSFGFEFPAWSPEGQRIALTQFISLDAFTYIQKLSVMSADGSGMVELIASSYFPRPAWSPDGQFIAFFGLSGGIDWVSADGAHSGHIVPSGHSPAWRP